ncbi:MarR family transcriptional regulator [Robbsia andropogonis]|uniref:MarR family transcriptional regulator n=1 Tax=Robbsia andropogonis TaxID=28092 RepID=A0A0F5K4H3_9BURK|nr:MarR family transcriptional regulator [Robbsia andropogonis]KKB64998.1 MarR family transcriptional regulator [Robbsia andropogonis]
MDIPPSSPDAFAFRLAEDVRTLTGKLKRRLREQADPGDFTPSQKTVLLRLEKDEPIPLSQLARNVGIRSQSMGEVITALEAAGQVSRRPDPNDGRQTLLTLTDACRQRMQSGRATRQDWLFRQIQEALSIDEQRQLADAVELIRRLVEHRSSGT